MTDGGPEGRAAPAARPGVMEISAYVGGASGTANAARTVKLSSNECAWGPSPKAIAAFEAASKKLYRYPDGGAADLRAAIARRFGLDPSRIVCGAGSDEIISLLCQAYLAPGDEVLYSAHGFLMYRISTLAAGGVPVTAPETDLRADVDALLAKVTDRTRIVFLANPNNPTGTYLPSSEVRRLHAGLRPDILLVLDAAYAEFVRRNDYEAGIEMVATSENVVMTRTFSKLYGLAGLRVGWAYCPAGVADVLNRVRGPFNVNLAAQAAAAAALADAAWAEKVATDTIRLRAEATERLTALGLAVTPSEGNFILVHFPEAAGRTAQDADAFLQKEGVIVRRMEGYGLPAALRISIGTEDETRACLESLTAFVESWGG